MPRAPQQIGEKQRSHQVGEQFAEILNQRIQYSLGVTKYECKQMIMLLHILSTSTL